MPTYAYKARDAIGAAVSGTMDAATKEELIDKLRKMGYMTTSVIDAGEGIRLSAIADRLRRIASEDMLLFYIQLSNMISAGITVLASLTALTKQIENKALSEAVGNVARQVESGSAISQAFAASPGIFTKLFTSMIKAGEASGNLDVVLTRYADFFEKQEDLKQKIKGALFYPVILLCAGIAVTLFIITFVIPQFAEIYLKAGIKLPVPTLIVYKAGIVIKHYWYLPAALTVAALFGLRHYSRTQRGALSIDKLKLKLPIIGPLYRKVAITRFARTLATLLGSGVPILQSLDITREVIGNEVLSRVIVTVSKAVEGGDRMSGTLGISKEFPPDVIQMIAVGEETGAMDKMLNKIADFYDMNVNYAVRKLTIIIEPLFLGMMGVIIGFIMASMLLPMFDMVKALRH